MSIGDFSVILSLEKFSSLFLDDFSKRKIFGHDKSICQKTYYPFSKLRVNLFDIRITYFEELLS